VPSRLTLIGQQAGRCPAFMNVSTAMETTLNMARGLIRQRYVPSTAEATGTAKGASSSTGKTEAEEVEDAE